ncbi:hypothetical protein MBLNU230_g5422t1 [Neophaeotheca triangularis]
MAPRILIFGSGAIGTIYAYLLTKAGSEVTTVCRSNYEAAKANGFRIDSALYGHDLHITPHVVRTPEEAAQSLQPGEHFDYILVCNKVLPGGRPTTAELLAPAVTPTTTTVVLIQNGIDIEEEYLVAFPENPLLSCVVYLPVTQTAPGHISMGKMESLEIGTYPASAYQRTAVHRALTDKFAETLQSAGGNAKVYEDIQPRRWIKLMLNASWNPVCALTMSRDVAYLASSDVAEAFARDVMLEVVTVAQAAGYVEVDAQVAERQLDIAKGRIGTAGIEPSMLVDLLQERRMEVEVILGNPIKVAKEKGVSVPRLEALYALLKALDQSVALRQPGESLGGVEAVAARA